MSQQLDNIQVGFNPKLYIYKYLVMYTKNNLLFLVIL